MIVNNSTKDLGVSRSKVLARNGIFYPFVFIRDRFESEWVLLVVCQINLAPCQTDTDMAAIYLFGCKKVNGFTELPKEIEP